MVSPWNHRVLFTHSLVTSSQYTGVPRAASVVLAVRVQAGVCAYSFSRVFGALGEYSVRIVRITGATRIFRPNREPLQKARPASAVETSSMPQIDLLFVNIKRVAFDQCLAGCCKGKICLPFLDAVRSGNNVFHEMNQTFYCQRNPTDAYLTEKVLAWAEVSLSLIHI